MIFNSLFPVFVLLGIGTILRKFQLTGELFLKTADKLVYYIFFPALLFWKIGGAASVDEIDLSYCIAALATCFIIFILSLICIRLFRISNFGAGTFSQSCYRFNTYIGMAVIINAFGVEGIRYFGILISITIPFINVMAISTLIWFSGMRIKPRQRILMMSKALISNPLILSCIAGILYSRSVGSFPTAVVNTFQLMTSVTLPLALLSIGGALTFKSIRQFLNVSVIASVAKLLLMPLIGYFLLRAFGVTGVPFKVSMIFFTLPTATSIYILSSQLNSDTDMASATILLSTILSFFSLTIALLL
ncbi:MAG: AEC family transporter [Deltaproteobacteria bacterium]|nr:AEC family transporter [Deltaproteobacteria bacterium]MBT6502409.1 AEC family transporter [Deltaproteobacteria bacterium]MBT6613380.1 AEC family transporter [Deltaproteobacteria bacterium]MBT7156046.1 AEC family transporter [Deltaproteobacteria bacterium]MBT7710890.1 AEC family transporter [Deltaproteobacteria bacterium]